MMTGQRSLFDGDEVVQEFVAVAISPAPSHTPFDPVEQIPVTFKSEPMHPPMIDHEKNDNENSNPAHEPVEPSVEPTQVQAPAPTQAHGVFVPDIMLVDIAGLGYAAMYSPLGKLAHNGFPTGGIHGAIASLFARMEQRPGAVPVVLWDNRAHWRHESLPQYKSSRGADPEKKAIRDSYQMQVPYIQMLLQLLGIPQVSCADAEADDLAGVICRNIDPSWKIELVSRDEDWLQALRENIVWYSPVHKKGLSLASFMDPDVGTKDGHYLSTAEFLEAKALAGDASDEIPGIAGIGPKTAVKVIREHGTSIRDFWVKVDSGEVKPKGVKVESLATSEARAIFKRNIKLMDWSQAPQIKHESLALTAGKTDWAQLEEEAMALGLKKLISNSKEILKPWKHGWGSAIAAVDCALNHHICQIQMKPFIQKLDF